MNWKFATIKQENKNNRNVHDDFLSSARHKAEKNPKCAQVISQILRFAFRKCICSVVFCISQRLSVFIFVFFTIHQVFISTGILDACHILVLYSDCPAVVDGVICDTSVLLKHFSNEPMRYVRITKKFRFA